MSSLAPYIVSFIGNRRFFNVARSIFLSSIGLGKLMKSFYGSWNKEVIDDAVILENIQTISGGKLDIDLGKVREDNLFEKLYKAKTRKSYEDRERESHSRGGGRGRNNNRKGGGGQRRRRN